MDKSKAREFLDAHVLAMARYLSVSDWTINLRLEPGQAGEDGSILGGSMARKLDYRIATLTINPEAMAGDDDLLDVLFHELCHLIIAPFDLYYEAAAACTKDNTDDPLERVFTHAMEATIKALEWSWHQSGWRQGYLDQFTSPEPKG